MKTTMAKSDGEAVVTKDKREPIQPIIWRNLFFITLFHVIALYALWRAFFDHKPLTMIWAIGLGNLAGIGVTAGAHRLWSHRAYKAKWPLKVLLLFLYSIAGQNTLYDWVRDHRVHHKYSETDADPHDARRGFFFAHVGWLMCKKHPEVIKSGRKIDMSDILEDPLITFHTKYFTILKIALCFVMPVVVPVYLWNETWFDSILYIGILRYILGLNFTWSVNSAAHLWGNKPYDKSINPAENKLVSFIAVGEGFHNYHHTFPWDYKTSELGYSFNLTTLFIDFFAWLGWAYDMKTASTKIVEERAQRTGDGSHPSSKMTSEKKKDVLVPNILFS